MRVNIRHSAVALVSIILSASSTIQAFGQEWTATMLHPMSAPMSAAFRGHDNQIAGQTDTFAILFTTDGDLVNLTPIGATAAMCFDVHMGKQVGDAVINGTPRASLWSNTAGSWVNLHPLVASESHAVGVHLNTQVGFVQINGVTRASLWTGSAASWVDLHPDGATFSSARSVFGPLQVGDATFNGKTFAGVWAGDAKTWTPLSMPPNADSAGAFDTDGTQVVGAVSINNEIHAIVWNSDVDFIDLHPIGIEMSHAFGVFDNHQVGFVTSSCLGQRACIWNGHPESWVDLHQYLPAPDFQWLSSSAQSVWVHNGRMYVAGFATHTPDKVIQAVLWHREITDPKPPCPADINNDDLVNVLDLLAVINGWGACPEASPGTAEAGAAEDQIGDIEPAFLTNMKAARTDSPPPNAVGR